MCQALADTARAARFYELQHETVLLAAMLHHEPGAIIFGVPQHVRRGHKLEARLAYLVGLERLVDTGRWLSAQLGRDNGSKVGKAVA